MANFATCRSCFGPTTLVEDTTRRKGIVSSLVLPCSECDEKVCFMSSKITSTSHYENNLRLVYNLRSIGKGQAAAETLCSVMNMPPPPSKFFKYNNILLKSVEKVSTDSMSNATRQSVIENEGNSDICVAVDGTRQKRGHTSKHGVITVTSVENGKVLDVLSLSKYCPVFKNENKKCITIP